MLKHFILFAVSLMIISSSAATISAQKNPVAANKGWKTDATEMAPRGDNFDDVYGLLKKVRVGKHKGFDRIVFELTGRL